MVELNGEQRFALHWLWLPNERFWGQGGRSVLFSSGLTELRAFVARSRWNSTNKRSLPNCHGSASLRAANVELCEEMIVTRKTKRAANCGHVVAVSNRSGFCAKCARGNVGHGTAKSSGKRRVGIAGAYAAYEAKKKRTMKRSGKRARK